jgi:hypothetical protein
MAKYIITAVRKKELPKKAGGTWTKVEIKTDQTGDQILELGNGLPFKREDVKVGSVIEGYIEKKQWGERDGAPQFNVKLNGITVEYVYAMLLSVFPELKDFQLDTNTKKVDAVSDGFDSKPSVDIQPTIQMDEPTEDPGF